MTQYPKLHGLIHHLGAGIPDASGQIITIIPMAAITGTLAGVSVGAITGVYLIKMIDRTANKEAV